MAHNCLLTGGTQLKHSHIPVPDACCFCGLEEMVEHAFFMSQYAYEI